MPSGTQRRYHNAATGRFGIPEHVAYSPLWTPSGWISLRIGKFRCVSAGFAVNLVLSLYVGGFRCVFGYFTAYRGFSLCIT